MQSAASPDRVSLTALRTAVRLTRSDFHRLRAPDELHRSLAEHSGVMADVDRIAREVAAPTMGLCRSTALIARGMRWSTIARRVEREIWARPYRGVVDITRQGWTWPRRVMAALLSCPSGTLASFRTAAGLHDLPGLPRGGRIEVTTPRRGRTRDAQFTVHSTLHPDAGVDREGVPCTGPPRTSVDLARCLDDRSYARAVREFLRRGDVRVDHVDDDVLQRLPGHARFARCVEREWAAAQLSTESVLEDDVVDWLLARGFTGFTTQHDVAVDDVRDGAPTGHRADYRLDVAWPEHRVVVSVVGSRWHADALARAADAQRRRNLEAAGWTVIEVRADDLHGEAALRLADRIHRALSV